MTVTVQTVLMVLLLLQVKHMFADFFLQTPAMLADRSRLWHSGRLAHVTIHAGLSLVIFVFGGAPLIFALLVCLAELITHYLIDLSKGLHSDKTGDGPDTSGYWRAFGMDQLAHQITYVAMVWAWAVFGL